MIISHLIVEISNLYPNPREMILNTKKGNSKKPELPGFEFAFHRSLGDLSLKRNKTYTARKAI